MQVDPAGFAAVQTENAALRARVAELERQLACDASERRRRDARYRALFEQSMDALLIFDEGGICLQANLAACRLLGLSLEQVVGKPAGELFGHGQLAPAGQGRELGEMLLRRADGELRVVEYLLARIGSGVYQCILRDVTVRHKVESQSREQLRAAAVLRERERLARELHDGVGRALSYIELQARAACDFIVAGRASSAAASLGSLLAVAGEAQQDLQAYILGARAEQRLAAPAQEDEDLLAALRRQIAWAEQLYGLHVVVAVDAEIAPDAVSPLARLHLTRIVHEALANVHRHAGIREAAVGLRCDGERLILTVADRGRGFDPGAADASEGGFGLWGMRSRADEIGGRLSLISRPGAGAVVRVELPLWHGTHSRDVGLRVLLVDGGSPFIEALQILLAERGLAVLGVAPCGEVAIERARAEQPDVVIVDVDAPCDRAGSLAVVAALRDALPTAQVVVLAAAEDARAVFEVLRHGASGYLPKSLAAAALGEQLAGLARGEPILPPALGLRLLGELAARESDLHAARLSEQQIKVLTMLGQGMTYKAIGQALGYSERAIKYQAGNAIKALGLRDRAAAEVYARRQLWLGAWPGKGEG